MQIQKGQLCDSCRNIHPVMNNGKPLDESIGDLLDSDGYKTWKYTLLNQVILGHLQENGGCSKCINLFLQATNSV